jgi:hypothetical protein
MMDLADHGDALTAIEAFNDPDFPQRLGAVEVLRHEARRQPLELALVAGLGQRRVAHVVVDVEVVVVHPDRRALKPALPQPLAVARDQVQA